MKTIFILVIAFLSYVDAQSAVTSLKGMPSPPASAVPSPPKPLKNAALWHQAVALDMAGNMSSNATNQYFYSLLSWLQSLENSSNNYLAGASGFVYAGSYTSRILQDLQNYPIRFDQKQVSDPKQSPSKSQPVVLMDSEF